MVSNNAFSFSLLRIILVFLIFYIWKFLLGHHIPALEFLKFLAFSVLVSYKRVSYIKKECTIMYAVNTIFFIHFGNIFDYCSNDNILSEVNIIMQARTYKPYVPGT